ncbi:hypothetical protein Pfo_026946 [Paulownia fortunei]|nr:hypothetical protein Pfo_026946 [Paulownia fortunei]
MATVLEHSKISPPPDSVPEFSLPIVFFDMVWYDFQANQSVLFFQFPCSKSHFLDTIVPDLKSSLSLALSHFLPLAGNIIHPLTPGNKPILRFESGDSVSFIISESSADFNHLTGNHPRVCDEFYAFAPHLPPATRSENSITCPVLALQVTLFPGQGLCIGFITHHAVADASNCLPFYDRKTVTNLNGLDSIYWDLIVEFSSPVEPPPVKLPFNKLRETFVLKKEEIQELKNLVLAKFPGVAYLSSFTVMCALVWVCSAKSAAPGGEEVAEDEPEYFGFVADCRGRLKPHCLLITSATHGEVKGPDGFVMAAKAIGQAIKENVYNEKGIVYDAENWPEEYGKLIGKRQYGVAGSPRFDFYAADYGWGKPKKFEALFIDGGGAISLCKSRDFEGGLEIGLSKPKVQMDAFATVFRDVLSDLLQ